MVEQFTATVEGNKIIVKCISVSTPNGKGGTDVTIKVPNLETIQRLKAEHAVRLLNG